MAKIADTGAFLGAMSDPIMRQLVLRQQMEERARLTNQQNELQKIGFVTDLARLKNNKQFQIAQMAQAMREGKANREAALRNMLLQHRFRLGEIDRTQGYLGQRESTMRDETRQYQEAQKTIPYVLEDGSQTTMVTPGDYARLMNAESNMLGAAGGAAGGQDNLSFNEASKLVDRLLASQLNVSIDSLNKRALSPEVANTRQSAIKAVMNGVPVKLAFKKVEKSLVGQGWEKLRSIFDGDYVPEYYEYENQLQIGNDVQPTEQQPEQPPEQQRYHGIDMKYEFPDKASMLSTLKQAGVPDEEIENLSRKWDMKEKLKQTEPKK